MTKILDVLIRKTGLLCRIGVLSSGALFVAISLAVAVAVVLRKVFEISIVGIDEISGFVLAMSCSWGFAFALLHRAHVRIDTIQLVLPRKAWVILDIISVISLGGFMAILAWHASTVLLRSIELDSTALMLDFPVWLPQAIWLAGFVVFVVLALLLLVRALVAFAGRDLATIHGLIGSRSAYEETDLEAQQVERHRGGHT